MSDSAPSSESEHTQDFPEVFCKRCQHRFACEKPELSGAVDCPGCSRVAWLSKDDEAKVRDAASRQLKDGSYSRRFLERRSIHQKALALLPETQEKCARLANKLRRGAVDTCPSCLYNLAGVLDGDDPMPCPECGEQTSRPANILLWGQRANTTGVHSKIARFGWLAVSGWYYLTGSLKLLFENVRWMSDLLDFADLITVISVIGLPIGVCHSAYTWLSLRNPTMNGAIVLLLAIVFGVLNLAATVLLMVVGSLMFYYT